MFSGLVRHEYPRGKTPKQADSFISQFMTAKGEFSPSKFWAMGWVHPSQKTWWTRMVSYVTEQLREPLLLSGLYSAVRFNGQVRSVWYPAESLSLLRHTGVVHSRHMHFLHSKREVGFAPHEMYEVSGLPIGELPYEEYVPGTEELHLLKDAPQVYETCWEVLCHYQIRAQITELRARGVT